MKANNCIITSCKITSYPRPMPEGMFDKMPQVWVTLDDGSEYMLFEFYPDEIDFNESDFIGLTIDEAHHLKREKDMKYIQS